MLKARSFFEQEKGRTEKEMVGWYHQLNGHEFEQALGDVERHGSLACCRPWGSKDLDTTEELNNNILVRILVQEGRLWRESIEELNLHLLLK